MKIKYIYHHLGLGDIIICNGLVRHICGMYDKVFVFCKHHDFKNVQYMYRDNIKINIISVDSDLQVTEFILKNELGDKLIKTGFEKQFIFPEPTFDKSFYSALGIPFDVRFDSFYVERDMEVENDVVKYLNPSNEKYIFTHGDLDFSKIRTDLKIIKNPENFSLFNLITLFENAEEIHLMESSLKCLINSYKLNKPVLYYHKYVRNYPDYNNTPGLNQYQTII